MESNAADHPFKTCLLNELPIESYDFWGAEFDPLLGGWFYSNPLDPPIGQNFPPLMESIIPRWRKDDEARQSTKSRPTQVRKGKKSLP